MDRIEQVNRLAATLEAQRRAYMTLEYPNIVLTDRDTAKVTIGAKYARVDFGGSGMYMVDLATGEIFGIKAYGVIHRGHRYGTLDTIEAWDWSGYKAQSVQS